MKKLALLSFAALTFMLMACNNNSGKPASDKTDSLKSDSSIVSGPVITDSTALLLAELRTKSIDTAYQIKGDVHADTLTYTGAEFGDVLHLTFSNPKGETLDFMDDKTDGGLYKETKTGIEANKTLLKKKFVVGWRDIKKKRASNNDADWYYNEMTEIIYLKKLDN